MKLTAGINFTNILRKTFFVQKYLARSFSLVTVQFGFVIICQKDINKKAAGKMLMKLTTGVNFINLLRTNFSYKRPFCQLFLDTFQL